MQDLLHLASGEHGTAHDTNPTHLTMGGKYVGTPTAVSSNDAVTFLAGQYGETVTQPRFRQFVMHSTTTSAASHNGTTTTGLGGFKEADVYFAVTARSGTSPTLDLYVDTRLDGTAYTNIAHFTQMTAVGTKVLHITKRQVTAEVDGSADANAGAVKAFGWADDLRVRAVVGGTSPAFTYRVTANLTA